MGIFTPPNNSAIMLSAPPERLGVAGGILNMMRALGLIFGVAISGLVFTYLKHGYELSHTGTTVHSRMPESVYISAFMHGFAVVMISLVAINIFATIISVAKKDVKLKKIEGAEPIDLM